MAFNGEGIFDRLYNWATDKANGVKILAQRMDSEMDGFATGLSNVICKDGQTDPTADLPMNGFKHTGVAAAADPTDYARYDQLTALRDQALGLSGGFVNRFCNPAFDVWQRGYSGSVASGGKAKSADRWDLSSSGATLNWSRQPTTNAGGAYYLSLGAAGATAVTLSQNIESSMAASLARGNVTAQFLFYNNSGQAIAPTLTVAHANSTDDFSAVTNDVTATLPSIPTGTTQLVAYSFASASAAKGLQVGISFNHPGNTGSVGILLADVRPTPAATAGQVNANPPAIETRPVGVELALCQRYFETSYAPGVAPGTANQQLAGDLQQIAITAADFYGYHFNAAWFKAEKRVAPTMTLYNPVVANSPGYFYNYNNGSSVGGATPSANTRSFGTYAALGGLGTTNVYGVHWTASADL